MIADSKSTATVTASENFDGTATNTATVTNSSQKFVLSADATFTITYGAATGQTLSSVTLARKFDDSNDHVWTNSTPATGATTENQNASVATSATYVLTSASSLGTLDNNHHIILSKTDNGGWYSYDDDIKVYQSTATLFYAVIPKEKMNGTSAIFVALKDSTADNVSTGNLNDLSYTPGSSSGSVAEGSTSYLGGGSQNRGGKYFSKVWYKTKEAAASYDVLVKVSFTGLSGTASYEFSVYEGTSPTIADTYYIGGRFMAKDTATATTIYTGPEADNWKSFSLKLPMTKVSGTYESGEFTLDTGYTVSELAQKIDNKYRYFIVHDGTDVYSYDTADGKSNLFEECLGSGNAITLKKRANKDQNLNAEEEMLFSDVEYESDGKVILHYNSGTHKLWYFLRDETTALGASLSLSAVPNTRVAGQESTLTATLTSPVSGKVDANNTRFDLYDDDGTLLETVTPTASGSTLTATFKVSDIAVRTHNYKVVARTDATIDGTTTYRSLSKKATVTFTNPDVYMTETNLEGIEELNGAAVTWRDTNLSGTGNAGKDNTIPTLTLTDGAPTYEFALRTTKEFTPGNATQDFYIDPSLTKYCDIVSDYITYSYTSEDGEDESFPVITYKVSKRQYCSGTVTLHVDTRAFSRVDETGKTRYYAGKIYGVSTYTEEKGKTYDSAETVTYYFAEDAAHPELSLTDTAQKSGVKIVYWNNSVDDVQTKDVTHSDDKKYNDVTDAKITALIGNDAENEKQTAEVTTKVKIKDGVKDATGATNTIYVDMSKILNNGLDNTTSKQFKIYSVELPVWATSFAFLSGDTNTPISARSIRKEWQEYKYGSLLLNPNRVYLLYQDNSENHYKYVKGVVLDNNLWNSSKKNNVDTQTFKSNVINYNKVYSDEGWATEDGNGININTLLSDRLYATKDGSYYANPLYMGYFGKDYDNAGDGGGNYNHFAIYKNLAQRNNDENDERYYFSSVHGLVANNLDRTQLNSNGFPILQSYDNNGVPVNMPLFDYDALALDKSSTTYNIIENQYLGVDFPMYKSTFNGITTYSYDSSTDPNRQLKTVKVDGKDSTNFEIGSYYIANTDYGYIPMKNYETSGDKNKHHWGNATELDIEFYMSNTGKLKSKTGDEQDIVFNFTGDDDVWVYVDGVLVLDLGGDHKASAGSINFTDMMVYYKTAADDVSHISAVTGNSWPTSADNIYTVDMAKRLTAHGVNFNNRDAATMHTFQMFYMERGAFDSNMSISYNLPQASGLNVKNTVLTNHVNPGLVNAALYSANKDYFSYGVSTKLATNAELEKVTSVSAYANANTNLATDGQGLDFSSPLYPSNTTVQRAFDTYLRTTKTGEDAAGTHVTQNYDLSVSTGAHDTPSTNYSSSLNSSTFTELNGIVYNLSDTRLSGSGEVTGIIAPVTYGSGAGATTANEFHLLGGQAAQFEDKVPANSLVKVYQTQNLGTVKTNKSTGDVLSPLQFDTVENNNVGNYYLTSYDIRDEHTGMMIQEKKQLPITTADNAHLFASDKSANENCFYFSDYSTNQTTTAAMTVNFYNEVAVGDIEITKALTTGTSDTVFYFDIEFAQVFGDTTGVTKDLVGYRDLVYYVKTGNQLDPTPHVYGKTGIALKPGQTAVIEGVPVETRYKVTERSRAGYSLTDINKTIESPATNFTPNHGYVEHFDESAIKAGNLNSTSDTSESSGSDTYYVNMIPTVSETNDDGDYLTTSKVRFTNRKDQVRVTFNYFDRKMQNSTPSQIDISPTQYTLSGAFDDDLLSVTNDNAAIKAALAKLISDTAVEFQERALTSNVVDDYFMWTSQSAAKTGITNQLDLKTDPNGNTHYEVSDNRTDYIGQVVTSDDKHDLWVSYYSDDNSTTYYNAESAVNGEDVVKNVKRINVWLYNVPHQYDVKIYGADTAEDLVAEKVISVNGKMTTVRVAKNQKVDTKFYYNQRFGKEFGYADGSTYLALYGIPGTRTDVYPEYKTAASIEADSKNYKFAYWAYDKDGLQVASSDIKFYYRVSTDTNLYAVYAEDEQFNTNAGLSVSANKNDTLVDNKGVSKTRLNVMFNIYNCPDSDPNIQQVALVNINFSSVVSNYTDAQLKALFDKYKPQLQDILKANSSAKNWDPVLNQNYYDNYKTQNQTLELTLTTKGYIRNVFGNAAATAEDTKTTKLTAKNRLQYTVQYTTSALNNTCYMMIGAMNYQAAYNVSDPNWLISDNCLIYRNGTLSNSDLTGVNS